MDKMDWSNGWEWLSAPRTIWCILGLAAIAYLLWEYLRRKRKLRALLVGAGSGLLALWLASRYGAAIGFVPEGSVLQVAIAGVLGVPGVLLLAVQSWL